MMSTTIFAVSSGPPPAAIGVIRVSGPRAGHALSLLAGGLPTARRASLRTLRARDGRVLDQALALWFPGPDTATGEDLAELHCHGGRAVLSAVEDALGAIEGLDRAEAGEFTRRAFTNGRLDLAQAEGLADLLAAETELQRASALTNLAGGLSERFAVWREQVLVLSARVEAELDFGDEDDVATATGAGLAGVEELRRDIVAWLERPRAEKLGEGIRVVLAGSPNAGKSTLFNALVESEAAITSPLAGTTRDVIERSVAMEGVPFTLVDTAGLRELGADAIERVGIDRARDQVVRADIVLWLGPEGEGPLGAWEVAARADADDFVPKREPRVTVSATDQAALSRLKQELIKAAGGLLPKPGEAAVNARQHALLSEVAVALERAQYMRDHLLIGEELRGARLALDRLIGRAATEDMLDALFGRFCIGK